MLNIEPFILNVQYSVFNIKKSILKKCVDRQYANPLPPTPMDLLEFCRTSECAGAPRADAHTPEQAPARSEELAAAPQETSA